MTKNRATEPRPARAPMFDEETLGELSEPLAGDLDVYQARISGAHTGLSGGGEIVQAFVDAADLAGSRFDPLALTDVRIRRGDVSNAVWEGVTARRVEIEGCRAVGWRVIIDFAEELVIQGCRWDHGGIFLGRTKGTVVFKDCSFAGTTLRGDFSRVLFEGCDLAGAELGVSAAAGCDLRTSRLSGARGLLTLKGARITPGQAIEIADLLAAEAGFRLD